MSHVVLGDLCAWMKEPLEVISKEVCSKWPLNLAGCLKN
jgi:hypothetical protein